MAFVTPALTWRCRRVIGSFFDTIYGVDTTHGIAGDNSVNSVNLAEGTDYDPLAWQMLDRIIQMLPFPVTGWTFIDIGSGKGRALLDAARLQFSRIIGIEYSGALCEVARTNISNARRLRGKNRIEIVHGDATEFEMPIEDCLILFNNPFSYEIGKQVISNIRSGSVLVFRSVPYLAELRSRDDLTFLCSTVMRYDLFHKQRVSIFRKIN